MEAVTTTNLISQRIKFVKKVTPVPWFDDRMYRIELSSGQVVWYPSVTTILGATPKPWLLQYYGNVGNREASIRLGESANAGSRIHYACFLYATGGLVLFEHPEWKDINPDLTKQNAGYIEQCKANNIQYFVLYDQVEAVKVWRFVRWMEIVKPTVLAAEMVVYSMKYGYAGRMDFLFDIKEGYYEGIAGAKGVTLPGGAQVWDLKSGAFDDAHHLQTASYGMAYHEIRNQQINGTGIIHLDADTRTGVEGLNTYHRSADEMNGDFSHFLNIQKTYSRFIEPAAPKIFDFPSAFYREDVEKIIQRGIIQKDPTELQIKPEDAGKITTNKPAEGSQPVLTEAEKSKVQIPDEKASTFAKLEHSLMQIKHTKKTHQNWFRVNEKELELLNKDELQYLIDKSESLLKGDN